jgi:hypothetical protein
MTTVEQLWLNFAITYAQTKFNAVPTQLQLDTLRLYCEQGWMVRSAVEAVIGHGRG